MKPTYVDFDHKKFQKKLSTSYDLRSEVGVLSYNYSKKIAPLWHFKTPKMAKKSSAEIYDICVKLLKKTAQQILDKNTSSIEEPFYNFIKADICRKFLLMGYTRSMRYYYHKTGTKWGSRTVKIKGSSKKKTEYYILPFDYDPEKKISAKIFYKAHIKIRESNLYIKLREWYKQNRHLINFDYNKV